MRLIFIFLIRLVLNQVQVLLLALGGTLFLISISTFAQREISLDELYKERAKRVQESQSDSYSYDEASSDTVSSSRETNHQSQNNKSSGSQISPPNPAPNKESEQRTKCLRIGLTPGSDDYSLCIKSQK